MPLASRSAPPYEQIGRGGAPCGLRMRVYPSVMPLLVERGLVEERVTPRDKHPDGRGWFLTGAGRETVRIYGVDDG